MRPLSSLRRWWLRSCLLVLTVLLSWSLVGIAAVQATTVREFPFLASDDIAGVVDRAKVVSRSSNIALTKSLQKLANQTQQQVHFVTIDRLDYGDTIESFTAQLFDRWFPTPDQQANQLLLVLDTLTNKGAIQKGTAVNLSDDVATSIATETLIAPLIQGAKYNQALLDASDRLVAVLSGNPDPGAPQLVADLNIEATFTKAEDTDDRNATIWVVVFLVVATIIPMVTYFAYVGFPGQ
ncbi:MAG: YgcG family protein [Spirulina sp. SIO3F2]|nr:YgcG family protein [Spirulina sp. SIO3F2]